MSDWISDFKNQDEWKKQEESEKREIRRQSNSILNSLRTLVEESLPKVNKQLFDDNEKVKIDDESSDYDFCVVIDSVPMKGNRMPDERYYFAYLCIKFDYKNLWIARQLEATQRTTFSKGRSRRQTLEPLKISISEAGNPLIYMDGKVLNQDEITKALIEPVIKAHRGEGF